MTIDPHRVLATYSSDVAYVADTEGRLEWLSPALPRVLGWQDADLLGLRLRELIHPDDAETAMQWREALLGPDAPAAGATTEPLRVRRAEGTYLWCSVTVARAYDDDGTWIGFTGIVHDVDALVRSRMEAAEAHARLEAVLDAQVEPLVTLVALRDGSGAVVDFVFEDANEAAASFHGMTIDEMVGATVLGVLGERAGGDDVHAATRVLESGDAILLNDVPALSREARGEAAAWLDIRIVPVDDDRVSYSWREVTERYQARREIVGARDLLSAVIDGHVDPHVLLEAVRDDEGRVVDFRYLLANLAAAEFEGWRREDLVRATMRQVYRDAGEADDDIAGCAEALSTRSVVVRNDARTVGYFDAQGRPIVVDWRAIPVGENRVLFTWRDVTERTLAQRTLAESEERFRLLAENMTDIVVLIRDQVVVWVSPSIGRTLGWSPDELVGRSPLVFTDPEDSDRIVATWTSIPAGDLPRQRYRMRTPDGQPHWVDGEGSIISTDGGRTVVVTARIVDAEVEALATLEDMARRDELTGLMNRHAVFDHVRRSLAGVPRTGSRLALVFCDLDGFKAVNDDYGHHAGDVLLRAIARRLESVVRSDDKVARIGGDELLVVLNGVGDVGDAERIAEKLADEIRQPTAVPGGVVQVSASIGVALAEAGESVDEIVARADRAMYDAKRAGKDRVVTTGATPEPAPGR